MNDEVVIGAVDIVIHVDGKLVSSPETQQDGVVRFRIENKDGVAIPIIDDIPYDPSSYLLIQIGEREDVDDDLMEDTLALGMFIGILTVAAKDGVDIHCVPMILSMNAEAALETLRDCDDDDDEGGFICDDCMRKLMDEPEFE